MEPQAHAPAVPPLTFIDAEVPGGTINGSNAAFTLANVPNPPTSLALFRNGLLLTQGGDYTLSSNAITFLTGAISSDQRRIGGVLSAVGEHSWRRVRRSADAHRRHQRRECACSRSAQTPSPTASLAVYRNGLLLSPGLTTR